MSDCELVCVRAHLSTSVSQSVSMEDYMIDNSSLKHLGN